MMSAIDNMNIDAPTFGLQFKKMYKYFVYVLFPYFWWYRAAKVQSLRKQCFNMFILELGNNEALFDVIKSLGFVASKKNLALNAMFLLPSQTFDATSQEEQKAIINMFVHEKIESIQSQLINHKVLDLVMLDTKIIRNDRLVLASLMPPYKREILWRLYMLNTFKTKSIIAVACQVLAIVASVLYLYDILPLNN